MLTYDRSIIALLLCSDRCNYKLVALLITDRCYESVVELLLSRLTNYIVFRYFNISDTEN